MGFSMLFCTFHTSVRCLVGKKKSNHGKKTMVDAAYESEKWDFEDGWAQRQMTPTPVASLAVLREMALAAGRPKDCELLKFLSC